MLNGRPEGASGAIATCSIEGTRPILLEIQAFKTAKLHLGLPRRPRRSIVQLEPCRSAYGGSFGKKSRECRYLPVMTSCPDCRRNPYE